MSTRNFPGTDPATILPCSMLSTNGRRPGGSHDLHVTDVYIVLYRSQDEASASEFCDSNYLSLSSLKMAGEARVSGWGSYIHPSRLTRESVIAWSERSYLI